MDFFGPVQGRSLQHAGWKVWASDSPAAASGQPRRTAGSAGSRDPVSTPELPKGLVEAHLAPSKMPPKSRHCCSTVALWQTPFFLMETRSMRSFPWGCRWHAGTPWPQAGRLGEPHSAVRTRKEGADRPVLAGCKGESACEYLNCTDVLARPGWDASPCLLEAAATALEQGAQPGRGEEPGMARPSIKA